MFNNTKCTVVVAGLLYCSNRWQKSQGVIAMKDMSKVAELIAALKNEIETPYELAAIERLEKELVEGAPKVEIIDETHQKFNGIIFFKDGKNHHRHAMGIYQAIWIHYFGEIPEGYVIHHKDLNPCNNDIANLQLIDKVSNF